MVMQITQKQEQKDNNNDANSTNVLILFHVKCKNETMLGLNMHFDYELIADNGKHTRTINGLNEDLSFIKNIFPKKYLKKHFQWLLLLVMLCFD